jgi:asparagine synthase (glutamine-hydrolysing)
MCGIAGIKGVLANKKTLNKILQRISHRGESIYQQESLLLDKLTIGMNRLAIVDEENGVQPASYNNEVFCIFNGEIYNYQILKQELSSYYDFQGNCDTEVLLKSYLHWGIDFLNKLDGKFAICLVDIKNNSILLARDHIGIKPLYYAIFENNLFFSSEMKSFCELPFIDEIKMLPPGTYWLKGMEKKYYYIPEYFENYEDPKIILTGIKLRLIDAVHKRIPRESKKIACLLSGGIDSSIITYIANKYHNNVEAFTFANPNSYSGDLESAKLLCNMLNIKHIIVSPTEQELKSFYLKYGVYMSESYESVLVRNAVSYHFVCRSVKARGYKYVLNGEGADELFGGYAFFKEVPKANRDIEIRNSLLNIHQTYLHMADRASMYTTIEARVPFMDKEFIKYCMGIPSSFRINGICEKWALREIFKNELPDIIVKRPKIGMNEGSGFGRNVSGESIYYEAVKEHYKINNMEKKKDLAVCEQYTSLFKINLDDIEEIYNFARFIEYKYIRYTDSRIRLQLNTQLKHLYR